MHTVNSENRIRYAAYPTILYATLCKNAELPPCMIEILENLGQLNGNMSFYFNQEVDFVLDLKTQQWFEKN